uniref:Protein amnionless n=1 Tax=Rhabditophanes sp. KR3021 TaxID=114890 RepID=A0AC35U380_9BILA
MRVAILLSVFILLVQTNDMERFWTKGEILSIKWKKNCLKADRCANPRIQIVSQLIENPEIQRADFPINLSIEKKFSFSNFFASGKREDMLLSVNLIGTDPLYNIPVDCDKTSSVRPFELSSVNHAMPPIEQPAILELEAKCFTAVIQLKKYDTICPWCQVTKSLNNDNNKVGSPLSLALGQVQINQMTIIVILGFLLSLLLFFSIFILCLYTRQRKTIKTKKAPSVISYYPTRPVYKTKIGVPIEEGTYEIIDDTQKLTSISVVKACSSGYGSAVSSATSINPIRTSCIIEKGSNFI